MTVVAGANVDLESESTFDLMIRVLTWPLNSKSGRSARRETDVTEGNRSRCRTGMGAGGRRHRTGERMLPSLRERSEDLDGSCAPMDDGGER